MGFRVAIYLHSNLSQNLGCSLLSLHDPVQDPFALLHWITVSQRLEPQQACFPAWYPDSRNELPTIQGLSHCWAWHLPGPMRALVHAGSKARDPECPSTKSPERKRVCTKLQSKRVRAELKHLHAFALKRALQKSQVQEASGSVQLSL